MRVVDETGGELVGVEGFGGVLGWSDSVQEILYPYRDCTGAYDGC
jgi:hypothetical protein